MTTALFDLSGKIALITGVSCHIGDLAQISDTVAGVRESGGDAVVPDRPCGYTRGHVLHTRT